MGKKEKEEMEGKFIKYKNMRPKLERIIDDDDKAHDRHQGVLRENKRLKEKLQALRKQLDSNQDRIKKKQSVVQSAAKLVVGNPEFNENTVSSRDDDEDSGSEKG